MTRTGKKRKLCKEQVSGLSIQRERVGPYNELGKSYRTGISHAIEQWVGNAEKGVEGCVIVREESR